MRYAFACLVFFVLLPMAWAAGSPPVVVSQESYELGVRQGTTNTTFNTWTPGGRPVKVQPGFDEETETPLYIVDINFTPTAWLTEIVVWETYYNAQGQFIGTGDEQIIGTIQQGVESEELCEPISECEDTETFEACRAQKCDTVKYCASTQECFRWWTACCGGSSGPCYCSTGRYNTSYCPPDARFYAERDNCMVGLWGFCRLTVDVRETN